MSRWISWRSASGAILVLGSVLLPATASEALGETLEIVLNQVDGTADFDGTDGPGLDSGPANGIVRTNDNLVFQVEVSVNDAPGNEVAFTLDLPQGLEIGAIPPYCGPGSSLTPAVLPPPEVPTTMTSWTNLPTQSLVCTLGARTAFSTFTYPVTAKVRSEVPNGTNLAPTTASVVSADVVTPVVSNPVTSQVSARARFDISKNSIAETENHGYYSTQGLRVCGDGSGRSCFEYIIPMTIAAPAGGKGTTPLQSPVTFTDDLTPLSLYGAAAVADPDYLAAGAGAAAKYGAILVSCPRLSWSQPYYAIAGSGTAETAVRDSGTTVCTQPGGPGTPVSVSITDMDSTAHTVPSLAYRPAGRALPVNRGYVYSGGIRVQIPVETVIDLGIEGANGGIWTLNWDNRYTDFAPLGIDGVANDPASQDGFNDHRASSTVASSSGRFDKFFVGVGDAVGNVPPVEFSPGWAIWEGPPGSTGTQSGEAQIYPGQKILSLLHFDARNGATQQDVSFLACDGWDPTLLYLAADNYPASSIARAQGLPSNGEPVWIHGRANEAGYASATNPLPLPALTIEYGNGPGGAGTTCADADSPGGWHSDPATVPGNDPLLAGSGVYTGVSQVRVHFVMPPHQSGVGTWLWVAIGLQAADGLAVDTILPNYASGKVIPGTHTKDEMLASVKPWYSSTYIPATNVGRYGDRVRVGTAVARLAKEVQDPGSGAWVTTTPAVTGGDLVDFRLRPSITAAVDFPVSVPVRVEDCLPVGEVLVDATPTATSIEPSSPAGAGLSCGPGETYVLWDLGPMPLNQVIPPIVYTVRISQLATSGVKINRALVTADGDPSIISKRTASASVQVTQPAGVSLDKVALTPQVEINRPGEANPDPLIWRVELANLDTIPGPTSPDFIDVLPVNGQGGTNYHGTLDFVSATVEAGGAAVELLFTSAPVVNPDPEDASNLAAGATLWCDLPAAGIVVMGAGGAAECPQGPSEVTGVRIRRPGAFGAGSKITVDLTMLPQSNAAGDLYFNSVSARAGGLVELVGPIVVAERIVDSSIGDLVWRDVDGDGIREPGDDPIPGISVELSGLDSDGNPVIASATTDLNGEYLFGELPSGTYTVTFGLPPSSALGDPHRTLRSVGLDPTVDSDGDPVTGEVVVVLPSNFDKRDVDQGIFYPHPGVSVVKSINGDDANTSPGVVVDLGSTMDIEFTVANTGNVSLDPVVVTDDRVPVGDISCPAGPLRPSQVIVCTAQFPAPELGGVHHNTATVIATPVPLADGTQLDDVSSQDPAFAVSLGGSIAGQVFLDLDENGARSNDESPIGGVEISLTGTDAYGNAISLTTTTDNDGQWSFEGLPPGTYSVAEAQPAGYNDGIDTPGSLGGLLDPVGDSVSEISLVAGGKGVGYDFAEVGTGLSGMVWLDTDSDGAAGPAEPSRIGGVGIALLDQAGNTVATTTTDETGFYSFTGLIAGPYRVVETQPEGYGSTTPNGLASMVPLEGLTDVDFGENLASVTGTVWEDTEPNGIEGDSEAGRGGVVVTLIDASGVAVASTVSASDGSYRFDAVPTGIYTVEIVLPDGRALTQPNQGTDDTVDSDFDWISHRSHPISVTLGGCDSPAGHSLDDCIAGVIDVDAGLITNEINLTVTKDIVPPEGEVRLGDEVGWVIVATNRSETPVAGVSLLDPLPIGLDFVSAAGRDWGCDFDQAERRLACEYSSVLAPGEAAPEVRVITRVTRSGRTLANAATVLSSFEDRQETTNTDNTDSSTVTVVRPPALPYTGSGPVALLLGLFLVLAGLVLVRLRPDRTTP